MFKIAVRDSLNVIKKHFVAFLFLVACIVGNKFIDYKFVFYDLKFADFLKADSLSIYIFLLVIALLFNLGFAIFYLFKNSRPFDVRSIASQFRIRLSSVLFFYILAAVLLAGVSLVMVSLEHMGLVGEVTMFNIYEHFSISSSFLYFLVSGYIFMYICFKFFFALVFSMLDKGMFSTTSLKCVFKKIKYQDILKIIISFLAYVFVIASLAEFFVVILELFMSQSAIDFFKFGKFNFYGLLYYVIKASAICIMGAFMTSYGMQLHHKFHSH